MKQHRTNLLFFFLIISCFSSVVFCNDETEFINRLKQNGYYELTLHHLDKLKSDNRVPASLKNSLDYERAKILLELARSSPVASKQRKMLDEAGTALDLFISNNRNHALFAEASSEKGRLLLEYARAEFKQHSEDGDAKTPFYEEARKHLKEAMFIFDQALSLNEEKFKKFKLYIDPNDKKTRAERDQAEQRYITAQYNQAICVYELSKTYEFDKTEQKKIRTKAFNKFKDIHLRYRKVVVGLYARMWQGKCYEDDNEYKKALGVYEELLSHPDNSLAVTNLQHQVLLFELICMNTKSLAQYQRTVDEATRRLRKYPEIEKSNIGLSIRWQRALALKSLADNKELNETKQDSFLRQSLDDAQQISQFPGTYRSKSVKLMAELNKKLGYNKKAGKSFSTAYSDSKEMVDQITVLQQAIEKSENNSDRQTKKREFLAHLIETRKQLEFTISLADDETNISKLNSIRYLLSYVYYLSGQNEKAGVLAGFVGHFYKKQLPDIALDSSYISAVSFLRACEISNGNNSSELRWAENAADHLVKNWPKNKYTMEISFALGNVLHKEKQYLEATEWFSRIRSDSEYFGKAQISMGQSFWSAVLKSNPSQSDLSQVEIDQINEWKKKAETNLANGIQITEKKLGNVAKIPENLIVAKTILSQIHIRNQNYEKALKTLNKGTYSAIDYMNQTPPDPRPKNGPLSQEFTSYFYQILLRCYVATQQIDRSLNVMNQLDVLASGNQDNISAIYVNLGKVIQKEIEQLIAEKKTTQLIEIQDSFDRFLTELYHRRDNMKYGSLIWIAETYYGLASGLKKTDPDKSNLYAGKALATYEAILERDNVPEKNILSIKLRQVKCLKQQDNFEKSYLSLLAIIKNNPNILDLQIEAATLLEEWGDSGKKEKFLLAIKGDSPNQKNKEVWGWGNIAKRIQRIIVESAEISQNNSLKEKYWNSRYHISSCRWKYANRLDQLKEKQQMLQLAQKEIEVFASLSDQMKEEWVQKFNHLYANIQKGLNPRLKNQTSLNWGEVIATNSNKVISKTNSQKPAPAITKAKSASRSPENNIKKSTIFGIVILISVLSYFLFYYLKSNKKKARHPVHQLRDKTFKQPSAPAKRRRATKPGNPETRK
jgi:hypothetical protein